MKKCIVSSLLFLFIGSPAMAQTPHRSIDELVSSNGFGVGHYSLRDRALATFHPHLYRQWDEGEPIVRDWLYDAYFGVRGGDAVWFNEVDVVDARYEPGTGIIDVEQRVTIGPVGGGVAVVAAQKFFFPFGFEAPAVVMFLQLRNDGAEATDGFAVFSLQNFHVGGGDQFTEGEVFERLPDRGWLEKGPGGERVYHRSLSTPDGYAAGSGDESPWAVMRNGADFVDTSTGESEPGDDVAAGFQFNVPDGLAPDEVREFGIVLAVSEDADGAGLTDRVDAWIDGRTARQVLDDARTDWTRFQAIGSERLPDGLSDDEEAVWRQSIAMLRMGQVREPNPESGKPHGQILAALPKAHPAEGEGIWNISWPRDASYAIAGLSRAGYADEARAGLQFMLEADAGEYTEEVGRDYAISVCRYYGKGREESDHDENGPNIEFDDFGLFLMALGEQVEASDDPDWWTPYWPTIRDDVAGALVDLQDDTGLISPDSSIWERHWNGNQKHFTYTSAVAARGLCVAAELAERMDEPEVAATYRRVVGELRGAIAEHLVDSNDVLVGNREEFLRGEPYLDLAAVEVFNFGLVDPAGPVALATLDRWKRDMYDGDPDGFGGYYRNDDGDWYDEQEWVVVDLRVAVALGYAGRVDERDRLIDWVTSQTRANFDIMGELYCRGDVDCPTRGDYRGSVPMIGFGPGAYIMALTERAGGDVVPEPCAEPLEVGGDGGAEPDSDVGSSTANGPTGSDTSSGGGCSCSTGTSPAGIGLLSFLFLMALAFRRFAPPSNVRRL